MERPRRTKTATSDAAAAAAADDDDGKAAKTSSKPSSTNTKKKTTALRKFKVGDPVKAKFRGKGRVYYPGKITNASGDKYDVNYDDGNQDTSLLWKHIEKLIEDANVLSGDGKLAEGDSQGRIRGGGGREGT